MIYIRIGIEEKYRDISSIFQILDSHAEEVKLDDILVQMVVKNVTSSDLLFLILQKLERDNYLNGSGGVVKIFNKVDDTETRKVAEEIADEIRKNNELFVTPLEVGKFYMCPRRLWLEKIVLSRQYKEESGKVWDGEAIHLTIGLFIKNLMKKDVNELADEMCEVVLSKYEDRTTLTREKLKDFVLRFNDLINEEMFTKIFTEKTFESFKLGIAGSPDIVCMKDNGEVVTMDIKLGKLSSRGVKEEHLLQIIGEALLVEDFFRKDVNYSYLIYFESGSLLKVNLNNVLKKRFINYKRRIERLGRFGYIPEASSLPNSRARVCKGCHVKPACDNIEIIKGI